VVDNCESESVLENLAPVKEHEALIPEQPVEMVEMEMPRSLRFYVLKRFAARLQLALVWQIPRAEGLDARQHWATEC
jgi:hypothetical protein